MQVEVGKRPQPSVKAADDDGLGSRRIFVTDQRTKTSFLVDTGADISVYPRSKLSRDVKKQRMNYSRDAHRNLWHLNDGAEPVP